jgi:hypothetical protein
LLLFSTCLSKYARQMQAREAVAAELAKHPEIGPGIVGRV